LTETRSRVQRNDTNVTSRKTGKKKKIPLNYGLNDYQFHERFGRFENRHDARTTAKPEADGSIERRVQNNNKKTKYKYIK